MKRLLVTLCFVACTAFALDKPPPPLVAHIQSLPLVHNGLCDYGPQKDVRCLVFADQDHEVLYIVLFDAKGRPFQILGVKDDDEVTLWLRDDQTV